MRIAEDQVPESSHERKVTWSLMAIVVAFVTLMTCIVLWITSSLIRNELGGPRQLDPTIATSLPASETPVPGTATRTAVPALPNAPNLLAATWTPVLGTARYVKFQYWYVRPSKIHVGECVKLTWVTENAVSLQLYRNDEIILEKAPPSGTLQDCPELQGYAVYRLVAETGAGESNWIQLQVKVDEAP